MQKFICTANLIKDPELSVTNSGKNVNRFSVAVKRDYKNENDEYESDFFNVVSFGKLAENCNKYLKKGSKVSIVGTIQNRSYEDKSGVKRYVSEVIADSVEFLTIPNTQATSTKPTQSDLTPIDDDSLPF